MSDQRTYHFVFFIKANDADILTEGNGFKLVLHKVDAKAAYMTARPGRDRAFIPAQKFIEIWMRHAVDFEKNPPQVAIMHAELSNEAEATPIFISQPHKIGKDGFSFQLNSRNTLELTHYESPILLIDWLPDVNCPKPIQLLLPSLFDVKGCV